MIRIAVVEDDLKMEEQILSYIKSYESESDYKFEIISFRDGDEITSNYKREFDIILMDIQMQFMDGITAAKLIRERDPDVVIIFITNMAQYAIRGYEVNALDYVLKPINYFSFTQKINRAIEKMGKRDKSYLTVSVNRGIKKIDISKIRYIDSQGHRLTFHMRDEEVSIYTLSMKEVEEKLKDYSFFRCNKSYLVNLEYVDGIEDNIAIVDGDNIIISRLKKNEFYEVMTNYIGNQVR